MLLLGPDSQNAVDKLQSQGIKLWSVQSEQVILPKELTSLDSDDLSDLFARLTAWSDFVSHQLSAAQIDERSAEKRLDFSESRLLVEKMGTSVKGERITLIKAQIAIDPTISKLRDAVDEAYAYRKMIETVFYNLERDITLISREITRRTNDNRSRKDRYSI
ncbi:MAG: hypothetical protein EBT07_01575 [Actinobacteria bacterium]|jgi:hypothetical protein|nr:hypothetical protein [Actinomycetota bacterium]